MPSSLVVHLPANEPLLSITAALLAAAEEEGKDGNGGKEKGRTEKVMRGAELRAKKGRPPAKANNTIVSELFCSVAMSHTIQPAHACPQQRVFRTLCESVRRYDVIALSTPS